MKTLAALSLLLLVNCCEGQPMNNPDAILISDFFGNFKPTELGVTRLIPPSPNLGSKGDYVKMLELHAPDEQATEVHVCIRSEYSIDQPVVAGMAGTGVANIGGPLVARLTWGVGGAYNVVEFDVPPSRVPGNFAPLSGLGGLPQNQPVSDIGNGIVLAVSGAAFTLELRNDANLSALTAINPNVNQLNTSVTPVKALAFITPGGPTSHPVRRVITVAGGFPNAPLIPGATAVLTIPSFAHKVVFPRIPRATTPLHIVTTDAFGLNVRDADIGINDDGVLELSTRELIMTIRNDGAVNCVVLQAYFDVDPE